MRVQTCPIVVRFAEAGCPAVSIWFLYEAF